MPSFEATCVSIKGEITSDASDVRAKFLEAFAAEVEAFPIPMAEAFDVWARIDALVQADERRGYLAAISYAALALHVSSMKLFLGGQLVAAGNLSRQVLECIAMSVLCSAKHLDVLERLMADRYSTSNAVRDVLRQAKTLKLKEEGLAVLAASQEFYHQYSHLSRLTLGAMMSFSEDSSYVGANFDEGKMDAYRKEATGRVNLAKVLPNIMSGVLDQLHEWGNGA